MVKCTHFYDIQKYGIWYFLMSINSSTNEDRKKISLEKINNMVSYTLIRDEARYLMQGKH